RAGKSGWWRPTDLDLEVRLRRTPPLSLRVRRLRGELLHEFLSALVQLLARQIFFARRDGPFVPLGIDDRAGTIAPELILHGAHASTHHLGASADGAIEQLVTVLHVDPEGRR